MPYYIFPNWVPRGEKRLYQPVAMFAKTDEATGKRLSGNRIRCRISARSVLPEMLETVMNATSMRGRVIRTNVRSCCTPRVNRHLGSLSRLGWRRAGGGTQHGSCVPGFTLAIKLRGTTLEAIGQHFVRTSFLALGALSLLLAGGIVLTYRNVSKEMALARLKSDFVSNVSHELRTPLSLIRLYAETLEMAGSIRGKSIRSTTASFAKKVSVLVRSSTTSGFLPDRSGRKEYDFRETDLRELVRNTLDSYATRSSRWFQL